ncbi:hypothetical protein XaC1_552 [Xanthomonas phage XaC1]|nr:hypothetical protein XaC1_552 [Xanthomonas phage XaC1]
MFRKILEENNIQDVLHNIRSEFKNSVSAIRVFGKAESTNYTKATYGGANLLDKKCRYVTINNDKVRILIRYNNEVLEALSIDVKSNHDQIIYHLERNTFEYFFGTEGVYRIEMPDMEDKEYIFNMCIQYPELDIIGIKNDMQWLIEKYGIVKYL